MAELPAESVKRIADARRQAETELKKTLSGVKESDDVAPYLPAFTSFAAAQFDAEAGEMFYFCKDVGVFRSMLENEVMPRIIDVILPDRSLNQVTESRTDEVKRLSIEHDIDTDQVDGGPVSNRIWEVGPDGTRKPARAEVSEVYAQHGGWENFMPEGVRFLIRWPNNNATVRAVLSQALQQRVAYWAGRFHVLNPAERRDSDGSRGTAAERANGSRKRGPKPDLESASRVAEIVACVAADGDLRSKLDEVCNALAARGSSS